MKFAEWFIFGCYYWPVSTKSFSGNRLKFSFYGMLTKFSVVMKLQNSDREQDLQQIQKGFMKSKILSVSHLKGSTSLSQNMLKFINKVRSFLTKCPPRRFNSYKCRSLINGVKERLKPATVQQLLFFSMTAFTHTVGSISVSSYEQLMTVLVCFQFYITKIYISSNLQSG